MAGMMEEMSLEQLHLWAAYSNIEPIGFEHQLLAQLCALVYNAMRGGDGQALQPSDFLPTTKRNQVVSVTVYLIAIAHAKVMLHGSPVTVTSA